MCLGPEREPCALVVTEGGADRFRRCYKTPEAEFSRGDRTRRGSRAQSPASGRCPQVAARSAEKGVDESGGFERREVVGSLSQSDQLDRHTELLLDTEYDAALGRTVQLGQH